LRQLLEDQHEVGERQIMRSVIRIAGSSASRIELEMPE
jgi:hypothetical protein